MHRRWMFNRALAGILLLTASIGNNALGSPAHTSEDWDTFEAAEPAFEDSEMLDIEDFDGLAPDDDTTQTIWTSEELTEFEELPDGPETNDLGPDHWPESIVDFKWPVLKGEQVLITCGYGCGYHNGSEYHAVDLVNGKKDGITKGMWVLNAGKGKVVGLGYSRSYGFYVRMDHINRRSMYYHLQKDPRDFLQVNDILMRGTFIGYMGNTGTTATGYHLHFLIQEWVPSESRWWSIPLNGIDDDWDIRQGWKYTSDNEYVRPPRNYVP